MNIKSDKTKEIFDKIVTNLQTIIDKSKIYQ